MAGFDRDPMWSQLQRLDEPRWERQPRYLEHLSGGFARTPGCAWGRPPGPLGLHDHDRPTRSRLRELREALDSSGARAEQLLAQRLSGLSLAAVWGVLLPLAKDVALCYGGAVVAGATLGGIAGAALGGVGIVPGALAGGSAGAAVGQWLLVMLGLKALAARLLTTLPPALRHYERGFRAVWDEDSFGSAHFHDPSFHRVERAASEFANGHVLLVAALLTLLLAYVGRGAAGRAQALQDIAHNPRLGPRMAQWLEENESTLARHPGLQPRPAAGMQVQAAEMQPTKPLPSGKTPRADHLDTAAKEAGSIRNVNVVGGTMNCVNCVIATDATLAGRAASALPGGPYRIGVLEKFYGTTFGAPGSIGSVAEAMSAAGPGARGIVFGSRGSEVGHVFNVVNQNGVIRILDGQTGRAASLDGFKSFQLLRTN